MPNESDRPAGSNTLAPELNPLSQPLLAENLRRWAEVYFSNPPGRRDQAVLQLLQELEREKSDTAGDVIHETAPSELSDAFERTSELDPSQVVRCKTCGHDNSVSQKFCGMCGVPVPVWGQPSRAQFERISEQNWNPQSGHAGDERKDRNYGAPADEDQPYDAEQESDPRDAPTYPDPVTNTNELSLFQDVPRRGNYDGPEWEYETSASQPYRLYIGLLLTAILLGLGYMAWRGTQTTAQSHETAPPPPTVTNEPSPPAQAAESTKPEQPAADASHPAAKPAETAPAATSKAESTEAQPTPSPANKTVPAAGSANAAPSAIAGTGADELSIAERYLSGMNGERRDTAEASKWLWRSVAKHNARATLLLADLYLRGDGVSKNCDQARVLLDSAARKGMPGAGERLRNLQAFGCQ